MGFYYLAGTLVAGSPLLPHVLQSMPMSSSCHPRSCFILFFGGLQDKRLGELNVLCSDILPMGCGNQRQQEVTDTTTQLVHSSWRPPPPPIKSPQVFPLQTVVNLVSWPWGMRMWAKVCDNRIANVI